MKPALILFAIVAVLHSQAQTRPLHFKKEQRFYFFQAGTATDTIRRDRGDLFYLVIPDSLKDFISVNVENGRLLATANDSIVRLHYLAGIAYESRVTVAEGKYELRTLINGATDLARTQIRIIITDRRKGKLLENTYWYR